MVRVRNQGDSAIARLVHHIARGEVRGVEGQAPLERGGAVAERTQIFDLGAGFADQVAFRRRRGFAGLQQAVVKLAVDLAHADDEADRIAAPAVPLHRIDRDDEADGRRAAGTGGHVDQRRLAVRRLAHRPLHARGERRCRLARRHQVALGVGERDARLPGRRHVGVDRGFGRRGDETVAHRRRVEQVAQIAEFRLGVLAGRAIGHQLGHIELQGGVLRQAFHGEELFVEPAGDLARPAVGDDSKPDLPLLQVALTLAVDEGEDGPDPPGDDQRQHRGGGDDDVPRALTGAVFVAPVVTRPFAHARPHIQYRSAAREV